MARKKTTEEFIKEAQEVHGDKYDYSEVVYDGSKTPVKIICKSHGMFLQKPEYHLNGAGCGDCAGNKKLTTEEFIRRAMEKHGDKYDYSEVVYVNSGTPVKIICKEKDHGEFLQVPYSHLSGSGCGKCAVNRKMTTEEFIRRAIEKHGDKYDYSIYYF